MTETRGPVAAGDPAGVGSGRGRAGETERLGVFARFALFLRQVFAELKKVIWPTRKELITYTSVALFFIVVMVIIVGLLDLLFARVVLTIFG